MPKGMTMTERKQNLTYEQLMAMQPDKLTKLVAKDGWMTRRPDVSPTSADFFSVSA
jgi:hypothetical protein